MMIPHGDFAEGQRAMAAETPKPRLRETLRAATTQTVMHTPGKLPPHGHTLPDDLPTLIMDYVQAGAELFQATKPGQVHEALGHLGNTFGALAAKYDLER